MTKATQKIFLTGFMGTGKSTVGKILAKRMGWDFVDTDAEVAKRSGRSIPQLFSEGEGEFRRWESQAIQAALNGNPAVVAVGGGAVCFGNNLAAMEKAGSVVLLTAPVSTLLKRMERESHRPLLMAGDREGKIKNLLATRAPTYEKVRLKVATEQKSPEKIAEEIAAMIDREKNALWVKLQERSYPLYFSKNSAAALPTLIQQFGPVERVVVVTDKNLARLHAKKYLAPLKKVLKVEVVVLPAGEKFKNLKTLEILLRRLAALKVDRKTPLLAFGGGVIGDVVGFAAAAFLRGIPFFQIPTSLVAQVDSSIGGKTGVDLPEGKNLVGAFYQPKAVWIDEAFLKTLPPREFLCGMAEVIKYGAIFDAKLFKTLEENIEGYLRTRGAGMEAVIRRCCEWKAWVVEKDERETLGLRAKLNFGHTLGHAIESLTRYRKFTHGEAVAMGMAFAAQKSVERAGLPAAQVKRLVTLLKRTGLPTERPPYSVAQYRKALLQDKKRVSSRIHFVYLKKIGTSVVVPTPLQGIYP